MNCAVRPNPTIVTLGYEGAALEDFIATLVASGVDTLVDVREFPISRKKGFSKNALRDAVEAAGIAYVHLVQLGCPKPVRDQYKVDKDWQAYTRGFLAHLGTQSEAIDSLGDLAQRATICLVCFERDYNMCHRTMVADAVAAKIAATVLHRGVKKGLAVPYLV